MALHLLFLPFKPSNVNVMYRKAPINLASKKNHLSPQKKWKWNQLIFIRTYLTVYTINTRNLNQFTEKEIFFHTWLMRKKKKVIKFIPAYWSANLMNSSKTSWQRDRIQIISDTSFCYMLVEDIWFSGKTNFNSEKKVKQHLPILGN